MWFFNKGETAVEDLSSSDRVGIIVFLLIGATMFFGFLWQGYKTEEVFMRYVTLAETSKAHQYIVPAYRQCLRQRSGPNPIACKGAVAKAAEMDGYKLDEIEKVFIDIQRVAAQN